MTGITGTHLSQESAPCRYLRRSAIVRQANTPQRLSRPPENNGIALLELLLNCPIGFGEAEADGSQDAFPRCRMRRYDATSLAAGAGSAYECLDVVDGRTSLIPRGGVSSTAPIHTHLASAAMPSTIPADNSRRADPLGGRRVDRGAPSNGFSEASPGSRIPRAASAATGTAMGAVDGGTLMS